MDQVEGLAKNDNFFEEPGKFKIDLESAPMEGYYWVIAVGEIDAATNKYPWSVVSVPFGTTLFILARNITEFESKYESSVLQLVKSRGFKFFLNKPLPTFQSDTECVYAPVPNNGVNI